MKQIRTRIRDKRGADYTDAELQRLASVKLEQFADPSGLRSDLLVQFQQKGNEPSTYHRHRGPRRWILMLLHPLLKRIQKQVMSDLNLYFEIIHNLVIETTRLGIEVQNLKMRVESLSSRVDFDERRGRALEQVVQYRRDALPRQQSQNNDGQSRQRNDNQQRHQQHQQQHAQPQQQSQTPAVSYGASVTAPAATPTPAPVANGTSATAGTDAANGGNRPNDQQRPDGSRRRRRRRRRRPGQSMAQGQPNNGGPNAGPAQNSSFVEPSADSDDGPDEGDDSPDQ